MALETKACLSGRQAGLPDRQVGVYLCSGCGIGETINFDMLAQVASKENKVPVCKVSPWLCGEENVETIRKEIESENLNRIVIGACSQACLTDVFKFDPKVFVDRVNLRENVAWSHKPNDEDTQMLAEDYIRMGIAKVRNCEPPEPFKKNINETILVVGGGLTGITSALAAANAGFPVVLTEKEDKLGGWLNKLYKIVPAHSPYLEPEYSKIEKLISEAESHDKIKVIKSCLIDKISGEPGNFNVSLTINNSKTENYIVGAIIQATGANQYDPKKLGDLGYGKFENAITSIQLEEYFKPDARLSLVNKNNSGNKNILYGKTLQSITFIQCAGSRDEKHLPYCSSVCCSNSLKQALYIREKYPDALIYIIFRDMRTPAQHELFYKRVQNEDNVFLIKGDVVNVSNSGDGSIFIDIYYTEKIVRRPVRCWNPTVYASSEPKSDHVL